jgi:hypothetical protein
MPSNFVTLFTAPKAFSGHTALIQNNAFASWQRLPETSVIVFGNESGIAEAAGKYNFSRIPDVRRSEFGTPLLDDIFCRAQSDSVTPFLCFINADIILPSGFTDTARRIAEKFPRFICTGRRWNIHLEEELSFSGNAYEKLEAERNARGVLYEPTGMDFFLFPKGIITSMPPFCIGRPFWDNWILWYAKQQKIPLIDVTAVLTVYHQDHSYAHVPGGDGTTWDKTPEADYNYNLVKDIKNFKAQLMTVYQADFRCTSRGFRGPDYITRFYWYFQNFFCPILKWYFRGTKRWIRRNILPWYHGNRLLDSKKAV